MTVLNILLENSFFVKKIEEQKHEALHDKTEKSESGPCNNFCHNGIADHSINMLPYTILSLI